MKTLIVYYSYSGITEKVANIYASELGKSGEVAMQRLKPKQEINTFLGQCRAAFSRKRADLGDSISYDVKGYDLIVLASPVWAFAPVPAVNTYLDKISGLEGKKVIILLTSGSGAGVGNCFNTIRKVIEEKKASKVDTINVPNRTMKDEGAIRDAFRKLI
jgi:flavodoxin